MLPLWTKLVTSAVHVAVNIGAPYLKDLHRESGAESTIQICELAGVGHENGEQSMLNRSRI